MRFHTACMDTRHSPQAHRARFRGRHPEPGRLYLITTFTVRRQPLFADWRCAWAACASLHASALQHDAELLCWVLMPDHWHGLVRLGENADLPALMHVIKRASAHAANLARGHGGAIWEPGYWARALRQEEDAAIAARYVVHQPVRARLTRRAAEYPYWDALWLDRRGAA